MLGKSWKTSAAGIAGLVAVLAIELKSLLDSDPSTVFSVETVIGVVTVFVIGWNALDKNVSSEQQAAK